MNIIRNIVTFIPSFYSYLKGSTLFHERKFEEAIEKFKRCLLHPKFNNELVFSFYGQSLCAIGNLEEGHRFLLKACELYESNDWAFESDFDFNLAKNTIEALKHIVKHTNMEVEPNLLNIELSFSK